MTNDDLPRIEGAIVLALLSRPEPFAVAEREAEHGEHSPLLVRHALGELASYGVASIEGECVMASLCARHLHALGLVGRMSVALLNVEHEGGR